MERLCPYYPLQDKRLVLRLWSSDVTISENDIPIFVGTIVEQRRRHLAGLITAAWDTGEYEHTLKVLQHTLTDRFAVRVVRRRDNEIRVDREQLRLRWWGRVLLVSEKAE